MNDLLKLFSNFTITPEFPNKGYLSEISSPSRLWLQFDDEEFLKLDEDINEYFDANQHSRALWIDESTLYIGMKIATFICGKWHRATVLDELRKGGNICLFADDFGTKGYVNIKFCRYLPNDFKDIPRKSIRACLHGICTPKDTKLFDLAATDFIIQFCYNRLFRIKIVKHHQAEDFYEIVACRDDGEILNDHLIKAGFAKSEANANTKFSIFYPSFNLVEKSPFYESYNHRYLYLNRGINFSAFEEEFIDPSKPYEKQLCELLKSEKFAAIRNVFKLLHSV